MGLTEKLRALLRDRKFEEADKVADEILSLISSKPAPQPPGSPPGAAQQSLQQKMARLQALAQKHQQAGGDMQPIVEIADGVQPLLDQQKFREAEALVDRALKLLGESGTAGEQPAAGNNQEPPAASAPGAKPLPCPADGAAIDLAAGDWALRSDCTTRGLILRGDAQLWVEGLALKVDGNIRLSQDAGLHIRGGSFTVAKQFKLQYSIEAKGKAVLDFRNTRVATNAGVTANFTSSYQGSEDSVLYIENVQIDPVTSWLLCNLRDRARVETRNSPGFPNEIYPQDGSTVHIEGAPVRPPCLAIFHARLLRNS